MLKEDLNKQLVRINQALKQIAEKELPRDMELLKLRREIVQAKKLFNQDLDLNKALFDKCDKALIKYG